MIESLTVFWFRRDLRIDDNTALLHSLKNSQCGRVLPIFIFDPHILDNLPPDDMRVNFIYQTLKNLNQEFKQQGSGVMVFREKPLQVFIELIKKYGIKAVYCNEDYEPYTRKRDQEVSILLSQYKIVFKNFKDQVIFSPGEVLKNNGTPYTVYTPFKNKWLATMTTTPATETTRLLGVQLHQFNTPFPTEYDLNIKPRAYTFPSGDWRKLKNYHLTRDYPAQGGSHFGVSLRFGTISIRKLVKKTQEVNPVYLSELIWREFFMHILWHFPHVVNQNFRKQYDSISWRNNQEEFQLWCQGKTGYPLVDAGMRELNTTGLMSNRVRMVVASFLCKHLLIDWRWGEKYFSEKLFDYELAANNGNWQWCAGTGCDAAPYFRIFNPTEQAKKFDPENLYIKTWVPEYKHPSYQSMVEHRQARERALQAYSFIKL